MYFLVLILGAVGEQEYGKRWKYLLTKPSFQVHLLSFWLCEQSRTNSWGRWKLTSTIQSRGRSVISGRGLQLNRGKWVRTPLKKREETREGQSGGKTNIRKCPGPQWSSPTAEVEREEISSAFQTTQVSSGKLFIWRESESHGFQMTITEMASVVKCTSNSNGKKPILCHLDHHPHLFSHLMGYWYTSKNISLVHVKENMSRLYLNV